MEIIIPNDYSKRRASFEEEAAKLTTEEFKKLRHLCKTNLFFLNVAILGHTKLSPNLHGEVCLDFDNHRHVQFAEYLLPRWHYKSTALGIGGTIQVVLPDDSKSLPSPWSLGPEARCCIVHEIRETASGFLQVIANNFISNRQLLQLFPECLVDPTKQTANKTELLLPRKSNWPELTIETMGVGARGQGQHYDFLDLDDLIGDKQRNSPTEMKTAIQWFDGIINFFVDPIESKYRLYGTRWGINDLYSHAHKNYGDKLHKFIRGFWKKDSNGKNILDKNGDKVPIFPEIFNKDAVDVLMKNPGLFAANQLNDPSEGTDEFDKSWVKMFYWSNPSIREITTFDKDPYGNSIPSTFTCAELDICFLIDPAVSGASGFVVTGMDREGKIYVLEAVSKAWKQPEFVDFLFQRYLYWNPRVIGIEEVNFSALYAPWLEREMMFRQIRFNIQPLKTRNKNKGARIIGLSNYFGNGQVYFNQTQHDLIEEYNSFNSNNCDHNHLLDALAHGPQIWQKYSGLRHTEVSYEEKLLRARANRSPVTGYSVIEYSGLPNGLSKAS